MPSTWQARKTKCSYSSIDISASCACAFVGKTTPHQLSSPAAIRSQRRLASLRLEAIRRWWRSGGTRVRARVFSSAQIVTIACTNSISAAAIGERNASWSSFPFFTRISESCSGSTFAYGWAPAARAAR